jgi:hypothetical protein
MQRSLCNLHILLHVNEHSPEIGTGSEQGSIRTANGGALFSSCFLEIAGHIGRRIDLINIRLTSAAKSGLGTCCKIDSLTMSAVSSCFRQHFCVRSNKSAISLSWMVLPFPTVGSLAISIQVGNSVRPMHLFGRIGDHDYYCKLLLEEERDAHSITRCSTAHHGDFRAVPRADRFGFKAAAAEPFPRNPPPH